MKTSNVAALSACGRWAVSAWCVLLSLSLAAHAAAEVDPVAAEGAIVAEARAAAGGDDDAGVNARLNAASNFPRESASSVTLARRAVAVCGWLRNDNEYARAIKLAERVTAQLAHLRERTDADRVERLYWEAVLLADILDRKGDALERLEEAEKLAPEDERIVQCLLQLTAFAR